MAMFDLLPRAGFSLLVACAATLGAEAAMGAGSAVLLKAGVLSTAVAETLGGPPGFAAIAAKVKPAVISVRVRVGESADDAGAPSQQGSPLDRFLHQFGGTRDNQGGSANGPVVNQGSGFFISADGYAVTNNHVIDSADNVRIKTDDGKTYTAKVVGIDARTDIALIKVDGRNDFPFVGFAEGSFQIGDWVLAVGNPFGLGGTVTAGIISARGRDIGEGPYDDFIQIDAPVNMGNSGGPTFNMEGKVIGVNTAIFSPSGGSIGIAFAIPSDTVSNVVAELKQKGRVTRAYMGVWLQDVTPEIADTLSLKKAGGALVSEPDANGPAANAGIEAGDVIIVIDDQEIKDSRALTRLVNPMAPGTSVKVTVVRDGTEKSFTVSLAVMPDERKADAGAPPVRGTNLAGLGLTVAPQAGDGLVITAVDPMGSAAERGFKIGDVILEATGKKLSNPSDLINATEAARKSGKPAVLLRVKSGSAIRYLALPVAAG
jgi:serine protease Do